MKLVVTHIMNHDNHKDFEILLVSLKNFIHSVNVYHKASRDLPFDWIKSIILPENKRGFKLSYPDVESDDLLMATKPEVRYVPSDDDERESVNESETVEGPFEDPDISRHGRLNLGIPSPLVYYGICHLPDTDEQKIWLEFKKFNEGTREAEVMNPEYVNEEMMSLEGLKLIIQLLVLLVTLPLLLLTMPLEGMVPSAMFSTSVFLTMPVVGNFAVAAFN